MSGINAYVIDTDCMGSSFMGLLQQHSSLLIVAIIILMVVMYYCMSTGMSMPVSRGYGWHSGGRRQYYR